MPIEKLIPSVDRRLSAWISLQGRARETSPSPSRPTITLSRQFGCEGYPVAETLHTALEERTGQPWTIFDKALIERVSQESHLSERLLTNLGDESRVLDLLASTIPGWRTQVERFELIARFIVRIAREGNAIIVGRGGSVLTQSFSDCYHFRLEAPREHRVASIQQRLGIGPAEAEVLVKENEVQRERFLEEILHCSVADTRYYHAVFNTSRNSVDSITRSILALLPFVK